MKRNDAGEKQLKPCILKVGVSRGEFMGHNTLVIAARLYHRKPHL